MEPAKLSMMLYGATAGIEAGCSVIEYINYATEKAAVLQAHLSRAPELTDKVIDAANKAAEGVVGEGNLWSGLLYGGMAGLFAGLALHEAAKTKRDEAAKTKRE